MPHAPAPGLAAGASNTASNREDPPPCPLCPSPPYINIIHGSARGGAVHCGTGTGGTVVVQRDDEHLGSLLHQRLPVVREEQVVVGDPVAHRVIGTHGVQQGGEEGQGVSVWDRRRGLQEEFGSRDPVSSGSSMPVSSSAPGGQPGQGQGEWWPMMQGSAQENKCMCRRPL